MGYLKHLLYHYKSHWVNTYLYHIIKMLGKLRKALMLSMELVEYNEKINIMCRIYKHLVYLKKARLSNKILEQQIRPLWNTDICFCCKFHCDCQIGNADSGVDVLIPLFVITESKFSLTLLRIFCKHSLKFDNVVQFVIKIYWLVFSMFYVKFKYECALLNIKV